MADWDRDDRAETSRQIICDDCGRYYPHLIFRNDFDAPKRLCRVCCNAHDSNPQVNHERQFREDMDGAENDDF